MTERNTCYIKASGLCCPIPAKENVLICIEEHGLRLLFSYARTEDTGYTQEGVFYSWKNNRFKLLPDNMLFITGTPAETIDSIPLVITASNHSCKLIRSTALTVVIQLSDETTRAVRNVLKEWSLC